MAKSGHGWSILEGYLQNLQEIHAQAFAYELVGMLGARPMSDQIMDNGFFFCVKAWASQELLGNAQPATTPVSPSAACNIAP
ncbi:MAG: hypothetical protein EKK48_10285 [Candidatus Melainabacteria bacterium]|nr:MAG: hypothetical protein EKK48_10285 [Candidatus Melainabacteria bacterium]